MSQGVRQVGIAAAELSAGHGKETLEEMDRLGDYILLEKIASGGMADIFRAVKIGARGFRKYVAIKRIRSPISEDRTAREMFVREAHILSTITHANIVQIYELGEVDGQYYIVMDYIEGKDLKTFLKAIRRAGWTLGLELSLYIICEVINGLEYVHSLKDASGKSLNLVHRDINPKNIFLSYAGDVKIIDFGIVKSAFDGDKTKQGLIRGKIAYLSPEQMEGKRIDRRTDIFATGIVLYEMLAGRRLFPGKKEMDILRALMDTDIVAEIDRLDIDTELGRILKKFLARDPEERYQHMGEAKEDLIHFCRTNNIPYSVKPLQHAIRTLLKNDIAREATVKAQIDRLLGSGKYRLKEEKKTTGRKKRQPRPAAPRPSIASTDATAGQSDITEVFIPLQGGEAAVSRGTEEETSETAPLAASGAPTLNVAGSGRTDSCPSAGHESLQTAFQESGPAADVSQDRPVPGLAGRQPVAKHDLSYFPPFIFFPVAGRSASGEAVNPSLQETKTRFPLFPFFMFGLGTLLLALLVALYFFLVWRH